MLADCEAKNVTQCNCTVACEQYDTNRAKKISEARLRKILNDPIKYKYIEATTVSCYESRGVFYIIFNRSRNVDPDAYKESPRMSDREDRY